MDTALKNPFVKWAFVHSAKGMEDFSGQPAASIRLTKFEPNRIEGIINTPANAGFVLLQNHYPRWELAVDGNPQPIRIANTSFMSFQIPGGEHRFVFRYKAADLRFGLLINLFMLTTIGVLAIIRARRKNQPPPLFQ